MVGAGSYTFKLGMFLPELDLPLEQALETARELGAGYVWFSRLRGLAPVAEWKSLLCGIELPARLTRVTST